MENCLRQERSFVQVIVFWWGMFLPQGVYAAPKEFVR
jgi:hypothetical protein